MTPWLTATLTFVGVVGLSGCVVYPTTRTFYEPNSADGRAQNRSSCGFNKTHDSLERGIDGAIIQVSPGLEREPQALGQTLTVSISIITDPSHAIVKPELIELRSPQSGIARRGTVDRYKVDGPRPGWAHDTHWITLTFDLPAGTGTDISIEIPSQALTVNGNMTALAPFRFARVTKKDIYYGSINC